MPIDFQVFVRETIRHHLETLVRIQQDIRSIHLPLVMTRHYIGVEERYDNLIAQFRDLYDYLHSLGVLPEYQEYVDFYLNEYEERNFFETLGLEEEYGFKMPNTNDFMPEAKMKKEE